MDIALSLFANGQIELCGLIVICVASCVAGFVDSIAGGGGFITFPVYLFLGIPVHQTVATNKLGSTLGTFAATIKYIKNGYMDWTICIPCIFLAIAGAIIGANLSIIATENVIRIIMLISIPPAAFYVIKASDYGLGKKPRGKAATLIICLLISFVMGVYDGFYGPGTGTFIMILVPALAHLNVEKTAGITKSINLATNLSALAVFLINGEVFILLGFCAGITNIIGNLLGAYLFTDKGAKIVRPLILGVLAIFTIRIICELTGIM